MNKINTRPALKMTIGNNITLVYEDPLVIDTKTGKGFYIHDEDIPEYKAQGLKIIEGYWIMELREPDGTCNRWWHSQNLGKLLTKALTGQFNYLKR